MLGVGCVTFFFGFLWLLIQHRHRQRIRNTVPDLIRWLREVPHEVAELHVAAIDYTQRGGKSQSRF